MCYKCDYGYYAFSFLNHKFTQICNTLSKAIFRTLLRLKIIFWGAKEKQYSCLHRTKVYALLTRRFWWQNNKHKNVFFVRQIWNHAALICFEYRRSFPGLEQPGCDVDHSPASTAEVKMKGDITPLILSAFMGGQGHRYRSGNYSPTGWGSHPKGLENLQPLRCVSVSTLEVS